MLVASPLSIGNVSNPQNSQGGASVLIGFCPVSACLQR